MTKISRRTFSYGNQCWEISHNTKDAYQRAILRSWFTAKVNVKFNLLQKKNSKKGIPILETDSRPNHSSPILLRAQCPYLCSTVTESERWTVNLVPAWVTRREEAYIYCFWALHGFQLSFPAFLSHDLATHSKMTLLTCMKPNRFWIWAHKLLKSLHLIEKEHYRDSDF